MVYKIALVLVACVAARSVAVPSSQSRDDPMELPLSRDDFEGAELMESRIDSLADLTGLIAIVKDQFQTIIENCIAHILENILHVLKIAKHNVLRLLSNFTVADIVGKVLDCLSNIIVLSTPEEVAVVEEVQADPVQVTAAVNQPYGYGYPYLIRGYRSAKNETS